MKPLVFRILLFLILSSLLGGIALAQEPNKDDDVAIRLYLPVIVSNSAQSTLAHQDENELSENSELVQEAETDVDVVTHQSISEDDLVEAANSYAADYGVTIDEAVRRLRLQETLGDTLAKLEVATRDRFAGAWIEHTPEFRVMVRLTGTSRALSRDAQLLVAESAVPIAFVGGARTTLAQLEDKLKSTPSLLKANHRQLVGAEVDVKTGEIVLFIEQGNVPPEAQNDVTKEAQGNVAPDTIISEAKVLFGLPVRVESVDAPVGDGHTRGGAHLSSCTSGFVVRHPSTGTTGYITAGHCGNTQTYFEYGGVSYPTTFISEIRDADQDVQWHTTSHPEYPHFYADSTTSYRILQAKKDRSNQAVGNYVCHRGKTTGYSCGNIVSKTFQPTYTDACPGVTCASVWIRVTGSSLKCYPGDSGGPWFNGNTAYGIYKGQSSSGTGVGNCSWAIYMAANYFGISLVFQ